MTQVVRRRAPLACPESRGLRTRYDLGPLPVYTIGRRMMGGTSRAGAGCHGALQRERRARASPRAVQARAGGEADSRPLFVASLPLTDYKYHLVLRAS